ncbi:MAG: InlB B-repeat-containing protein [Candidatus Gracilibacteria bacterium]|nr:InlB B-repeat-containing protein [Candidatus Gracilibacteria bacterium]
MNKNKIKAFTLVELIIVITILAILATIGFLSYQGYTSDARDSSRITSLKIIHDGLSISYIQKQIYPSPDEYIDILGVAKQGYIGETVSKTIKGAGFKDPKDSTNYLYNLDYTGKKIQLGRFLENNNQLLLSKNNDLFISQAFAGNIDYTNRYVYSVGTKVGIFLDSTTKAPLNERISTGSVDLITNTGTYIVVFSNNNSNSGIILGSGQNLLTNISIVQNSCVLGNTVITSGQQLSAYNTTSVAYNATCTPITRSCSNGMLSGDINYKYDTCSLSSALNCTVTTYSGYTVPAINHNITQNITKNITGGVSDISVSCDNGALTYGTENTNCDTNYVLQGGICAQDLCTGSAPDFSISNGTQKLNVSWIHNIVPSQCTFVCQAGYYWNTTSCARASAGYMVATQGQITQTSCNVNNQYQDITGQTSCKTVDSGYYSTPEGNVAHTGQTQCEANNYCSNGLKTSCPVGTTSLAGSTSSRACMINRYTVSGSFGTSANGATINACGKTATLDTNGAFSITANYGTTCNNAVATKANYTCVTTNNGPASLISNMTNIAGNCTINTQTISIPNGSCTQTRDDTNQVWGACTSGICTNGVTWNSTNGCTPKYTVTFNSNGGTSISSQLILEGATATTPTNPTITNYGFVGWYSDSGLTSLYNFSQAVTSNITLYAKWNCSFNECLAYNYYVINSDNAAFPNGCNNLSNATTKCILKIVSSNIYVAPASTVDNGQFLDTSSKYLSTNTEAGMIANSPTTTSNFMKDVYLSSQYNSQQVSNPGSSMTLNDDFAPRYCNSLSKLVPVPGGKKQWYLPPRDTNGLLDISNNKTKTALTSSQLGYTYWSSYLYSYSTTPNFSATKLSTFSSTVNYRANSSEYVLCIAGQDSPDYVEDTNSPFLYGNINRVDKCIRYGGGTITIGTNTFCNKYIPDSNIKYVSDKSQTLSCSTYNYTSVVGTIKAFGTSVNATLNTGDPIATTSCSSYTGATTPYTYAVGLDGYSHYLYSGVGGLRGTCFKPTGFTTYGESFTFWLAGSTFNFANYYYDNSYLYSDSACTVKVDGVALGLKTTGTKPIGITNTVTKVGPYSY